MVEKHILTKELYPARALLLEYEKAADVQRAAKKIGEMVSFMSFRLTEDNIAAFADVYVRTNPGLISEDLPYGPQFADIKRKVTEQSADAVAVILHAPDEAMLDSVYELASRL